MARTNRPPAHDLSPTSLEGKTSLEAPASLGGIDLRRAGLFAVVRQLEARAANKPRVGKGKRPEQSIVDLAQEPSLGFEASTLASFEPKKGRPQLRGHWLGLLGPMGPLPTHLTEFAIYERRHAKKRPFGDWLNLVSGRMLQLFYRAWAQSQPVAHADRPGDDNFSAWLSALSGAGDGAEKHSAFFARARVHYAGLFSGLRSAVAIEDGLSHLLCQPVKVTEFVPRWREFEPEDRTRLSRAFNILGGDAVLGRKVLSASDAFRITVRANSWRDYLTMLPGGDRFMVAAEAIEAFKPTHLEWDLCVEIADADAPAARLDGRSRLGWTTWVKIAGDSAGKKRGKSHRTTAQPSSSIIRADAHLRKSSMRKGASAR